MQDGLVALAGALNCGFKDWAELERDPTLAALRLAPKFAGLVRALPPRHQRRRNHAV